MVLCLLGGTALGATFVKVAAGYAKRLRRAGRLAGQVRIFEAMALIGESTEAARHAAQAWLIRERTD